ncbi:MAG: cation transporter, partial [Deltaproteobacteria bacterium]
RIAASHPEIEHVNEVLTMHMGPEFILVNLSVDFQDSLSADQMERTVQKLDEQIKQAYPPVKRIFIECEARHGQSPR